MLCVVMLSIVIGIGTGNLFACKPKHNDFIGPTKESFSNDFTDSNDSAVSLFAPRTGESVYDILYNAILNREGSCDLSFFQIADSEFMAKYNLWQLIDENPVIDYLNSYNCHSQSGVVTQITFEYKSIPDDYMKQLENAVEHAAAWIKGQLRQNYGQAELVCAINDYIAVNCQYAYKPDGVTPDDNSSNAYAVLVNSRAVCDGYAGAFILLARQFGLEAVKVSGITEPGNVRHAWNLAKVEGLWYHVDVTWNDPTPDTPGYAGHKYLLLSDKAISVPRSGSSQYHASWDSAIPRANDARYDDAFWVHEDTPISFKTMRYDEWVQMIEQTSLEDLIFDAVENNAEANVARFGYDAEKIDDEIRKLYPYIGYTYTTNSDGIVIKVGGWVMN